ncbi:MAG: FecR domain-containing protein [Tannerella sp.]|jgi:ferric-dicitrate binding protein FerR (iron transport regulator)|nr:FecR domain-containing protein [Tannerella sp.]
MDEEIRKYYEGELTTGERLDLLRKAQSDKSLKTAFIRHQHLRALLGLAPRPDDLPRARSSYNQFMLDNKKTVLRQFALKTLRYAAVIVCLIVGTWMAADTYFLQKKDVSALSLLNTLHVPAGQRVSLTLQDGTVVWLNAQTTLTYPTSFSGNERRVAIEGEAFFEVAKDAKKPFIVTSGEMDMKVLGTIFNVYNYPHEKMSRISLVEGSLQVSMSGNDSESLILKPNEEVTVRDGRMDVAPIPNPDYFLWKDGIYVFEDETLENIMKSLELYYDVMIEVKDPAMLKWKYTVKFRQRDGLREILRLMQRVHKFAMTMDEERNRVTIGR